MKKQLSLKVTKLLWDRLNDHSKRLGLTKTTVIILAIESYLSKNETLS